MTSVTTTPHPLRDLPAEMPHPDLGDHAEVFGRLVGGWDLTVEFYDDGGQCIDSCPGEWRFGWALDGRIIQDVFTYAPAGVPHSAAPGVRAIGTSLRSYEPAADRWQVIYLGAVAGVTVVLHGGRYGDGIRLEGAEGDGTLNRWEFSDITDTTFTWTGRESRDGGATWLLRQRMTATRQPAPE